MPKSETRKIISGNGDIEFAITNDAYPGLRIFADIPDETGAFNFKRAQFISSHAHGWNEFTMALSGNGFFRENSLWGIFNLSSGVERLEITGGKIRYKDNRIVSARALTGLRDRRERIVALTEWMIETNPEKKDSFTTQKNFEKYWKRLLFPELVSAKNRPPEYEKKGTLIEGGGVRWNHDYTRYLLPEELWELRDSGAMLRDWEEAISWIYVEYMWDNIINDLNRTPFYKIK